tara:strand:- start:413 stop:574 length:162 start_codon:yes stop_codon:yes gene_type:complete
MTLAFGLENFPAYLVSLLTSFITRLTTANIVSVAFKGHRGMRASATNKQNNKK